MMGFKSFLLVLLFGATNAFSQPANSQSQENKLIKDLVTKQNIIGVTAAYSVDGKIEWKHSEGYSDPDNNIPFSENTLTRLASIAKPMTAIAIMQLVEQNLINLDAPVQNYIPDFPKHKKGEILIKHLLSHTSGIDGYKNAKEAQTQKNYVNLEAAMKIFEERKLKFKPGTQFNYTTYGYVVLGVIIEKVSGLSFEQYLKKNIWDKAEMNNTAVEIFDFEYENKSQLFHFEKGKTKKSKKNNLSNRIPGGGIYSNLNDVIKFGNGVINNLFIKKETLAKMLNIYSLEKDGNPYGFGWYLYGPESLKNAAFGHSGVQTGVTAQLMIKPSTKTVAVILTNTSGKWKEVIIATANLMRMANQK